jgi:hypothetical protein
MILAFYKGTLAENPKARIFDRLVCWWPRSHGRFSHAEVVASRQGDLFRCRSSSARDHGVRSKDIDLASGRWVLVELPAYPGGPGAELFIKHKGAGYDYLGVLGFVLRFVKEAAGLFFCSEWCALELRAGALARELPAPPTNIAPSALHEWCVAQPGALLVQPTPNQGAAQ